MLKRQHKIMMNTFLNIAFAYGGRAEIVDAARKIAEKVFKAWRT
jgi:undecaprenyl pyrophosphate synthase